MLKKLKIAELLLWQQIPYSDMILTVTAVRFKYLVPIYISFLIITMTLNRLKAAVAGQHIYIYEYEYR